MVLPKLLLLLLLLLLLHLPLLLLIMYTGSTTLKMLTEGYVLHIYYISQ